MNPWFSKFPLIAYNIDDSGQTTIAVNILQRLKIIDALKNNYLVFYTYDVKEGEKPEMIADKLYGDPGYHWVVMLVNNRFDVNTEWPLSYNDLNATIEKKYSTPFQDGLIYAYNTIHHYEDSYGAWIDIATYNILPASQRTAVKIYDWEVSQNEAKRHIKLLDQPFIQQIDSEADTLMNQNVLA